MSRNRLSSWVGYHSRVAAGLRLGRWLAGHIPFIGSALSILVDKGLFFFYNIDGSSRRIDVSSLHVPHPGGILLGGNGIVSDGRVLVNAGVKFVGPMPDDEPYLERHARGDVFNVGDNVVFGTNSVIIGPVTICDDVLIGAMSMVNKDIAEPGVYVGVPARKIADEVRDVWFPAHYARPAREGIQS
ncbi:MAG: hypothetical protein ABJ242_03430 [Marinomonas sp.]